MAGKVYIVDFGQSRQLALGPGRQPPIVLPPSQTQKPGDVTALDPYSFDVYCAGRLMERCLKVNATVHERVFRLMLDGNCAVHSVEGA